MSRAGDVHPPPREAISAHYASGYETERLHQGAGRLERERTHEMLGRFLPPPPAVVLDVGGGPRGHACWLAARGYQVHPIDIAPGHVEPAPQAPGPPPGRPPARPAGRRAPRAYRR